MRVVVEHQTHFEYSEVVRYAIERIYLSPIESPSQRVIRWELSGTGEIWTQADGPGNQVSMMVISKPTQQISISVSGEVELHPRHQEVGSSSMRQAGAVPVEHFLRPTPLTRSSADLQAFGRTHLLALTRDGLVALASAIEDRPVYTPGATHVGSSALDAWARGAGVCQDHAHVMLAICRSLGVPARYVSGYLAGEARASEATHAWLECWAEGRWIGIDVTHRCEVAYRWIRLAVGSDYESVSPTRGVRRGGGIESMRVLVSVRQASV